MTNPKPVRIKNIAIPPGITLADILVDRGYMAEDSTSCPAFQDYMRFTDQDYGAFMGGSMPWTEKHCIAVACFTQISPSFWINLEHNFRRDLANGATHIRDM